MEQILVAFSEKVNFTYVYIVWYIFIIHDMYVSVCTYCKQQTSFPSVSAHVPKYVLCTK